MKTERHEQHLRGQWASRKSQSAQTEEAEKMRTKWSKHPKNKHTVYPKSSASHWKCPKRPTQINIIKLL